MQQPIGQGLLTYTVKLEDVAPQADFVSEVVFESLGG